MTVTRASIKAEIMAVHRATEMLRSQYERVCQDPFAIQFLPKKWVELLANKEPLATLAQESARRLPGINGAVVARTRFIDDIVSQYLKEGLDQIVILGAGYDSRAYRIAGTKEKATVFEVDDPFTQHTKIKKIEEMLGEEPGHVRYVPIDFIRDDLKISLTENGYDPAKRSLFIMEGLTFYLPAETIDRILAFIAKNAGILSAVVFDYMPPSVIDGNSDRTEVKNFLIDLQNYGEHLRFGLDSNELEAFLAQRGLELKDNVNASDCKDKYFRGQSREREISLVFWFAHAVVTDL